MFCRNTNSRRRLFNRSIDRLTPQMKWRYWLSLICHLGIVVALMVWILWCQYGRGAMELGNFLFR